MDLQTTFAKHKGENKTVLNNGETNKFAVYGREDKPSQMQVKRLMYLTVANIPHLFPLSERSIMFLLLQQIGLPTNVSEDPLC